MKTTGAGHEMDAIIHDHKLLYVLFAEIERASDIGSLTLGLDKLLSLLTRHFEREQVEGGMYDEIRSSAPRYSSLLNLLAREHDEIIAEVRELVEKTRPGSSYGFEAVQREAFELAQRLREHEEQEKELLIDSVFLVHGGES